MKNVIFDLMEELLELSVLELEYQHRIKTNPFGEKWLNSSRTRFKVNTLKQFLYKNIKLFLKGKYSKKFYEIALRTYLKIPYGDLMEEIVKEIAEDYESDYLYRTIFYRLTLDDLFILFTNIITWEHMKYPYILEKVLCETEDDCYKLESLKVLQYYVRFLDILSSPSIISLFDLDALKHTLDEDSDNILTKPLEELHLFTDWESMSSISLEERFPEFLSKIKKKKNTFSELNSFQMMKNLMI